MSKPPYTTRDPEGRDVTAVYLPGTTPGSMERGMNWTELYDFADRIASVRTTRGKAPNIGGSYDDGDITIAKSGDESTDDMMLAHESGHAVDHKLRRDTSRLDNLLSGKDPDNMRGVIREYSHVNIEKALLQFFQIAATTDSWLARANGILDEEQEFAGSDDTSSWKKFLEEHEDVFGANHWDYIHSVREMIARGLSIYMTDPEWMKGNWPVAARVLRDMINNNPDVPTNEHGTPLIQLSKYERIQDGLEDKRRNKDTMEA